MSIDSIFKDVPAMELEDDALRDGGPGDADPQAFRKLVESRRAVRVFDGTGIPEHVVRDCLDLAMLAPSSSNLQPWEFYWVRSPEKKKKLVEACLSQPAARTAAELIVCVARTATWPENRLRMLAHFDAQPAGKVPKAARDYYAKLVPFAYTQGPLGIFGFLKSVFLFFKGIAKPTPREPVSEGDMRLWAAKSTALACENLMLAFRAHGYDTCPMEGLDSWRVSSLLGLPSDARIAMVIGAGQRKPEGVYGPRIRFDRRFFVKEV